VDVQWFWEYNAHEPVNGYFAAGAGYFCELTVTLERNFTPKMLRGTVDTPLGYRVFNYFDGNVKWPEHQTGLKLDQVTTTETGLYQITLRSRVYSKTYKPDSVITDVSITGLTEPALGQTPTVAGAKAPDGAPYSVLVGLWNVETHDGFRNADVFVAQAKHQVTFLLQADEGYFFPGLAQTDFDVTINGKPGYLLRVMEGLAVVGMEFDPLDGELIPVDTISVTNLPEPAFGKHTNYDGVELGAPNQYYLDWQYWYPYGNDTCSPNDYFKPGVPYTAYMTICPEPGYTFTYSEDMNITVNGRKLSYAAPVGAAPDQPMGLPAAPNDDVTGGFGLWPGARMVSAFLDFPALTEDDHVTVDSLAVETRGFYNVDLPYMPSETESVFSFNASFSGPVESYSDPTWYLRTGEDMIEWTDPFSAENGSNYILSFRVKLLPGCVANEDLYLYVDDQRIPHSSELEVNSFDAHFDLEYDDENDRTVVRVFLPRSLQCLVTYDPGNGEAPTRAYCPNGEAPTRPSEDPTREGLTFKGWYKDETNSYPCSFTDQIDNDITLYARWEISHAQVYLQRYPVVGKHFEAGMDACYSPTEGARIDPEYAGWYDPQNRLWLINLCPPIVEGVTFQFRVTMFLDDNVDLAESFTARIDRKNATVSRRGDNSVGFYVEWVAEPVTVISHVDITDVVEPQAGAVATGSFTAPAGLAFDTIAGGVMWKDLETGDPLRNGVDVFQADHRYKGSLRFCAEDDSYLLSDDLTATVNGMPARVSIEPNY
ncbi:MAG: InlB B-repeat-containing protein, partial [Bacteroidales bacterium]|nr:InlB B-repeat-containing protein [Bacteroidales bacterium]